MFGTMVGSITSPVPPKSGSKTSFVETLPQHDAFSYISVMALGTSIVTPLVKVLDVTPQLRCMRSPPLYKTVLNPRALSRIAFNLNPLSSTREPSVITSETRPVCRSHCCIHDLRARDSPPPCDSLSRPRRVKDTLGWRAPYQDDFATKSRLDTRDLLKTGAETHSGRPCC